jgi:hypothetical protein
MDDTLTLPLAEVLPGTVLAAPVLDHSGAVLLPAGLSLTEVQLDGLRRRDVATLLVVSPEDAEAARAQAGENPRAGHVPVPPYRR